MAIDKDEPEVEKKQDATQGADTIQMTTDLEKQAYAKAPGTQDLPLEQHENENFLVAFTETFDEDNPKDWPRNRKWLVTGVLSATGFNRIMVSTMMAPALSTIAEELHMSSEESVMALSVYLLATAFGPLIIGPMSEVYGRRPILHITSIWFLIWNLVCGFAHSTGVLITGRLMAGLGASAIYALGAGVLGDVWRPEQRGKSLGWYMLTPLLGSSVGPILGGFITQDTTWRWMFWSTSIFQAVMVVVALPTFYETHAPTILLKRANKLRSSTGDLRYHTAVEKIEAGLSLFTVLSKSLSRPIRLMLFHPIVQIMSLFGAFNYGITYFVISSFSALFVDKYHQTVAISGLHYLSTCFGEIAGAQIGGPIMDRVYRKQKQRANGVDTPEFRAPLLVPGFVLSAIGMILYGWAAQKQVFWLVVDIGAFILTFGLQLAGQVSQAYMIDSYPDHTSSASAASQFLRSLTAFGFPLFAPKMYQALGYGWGNSMLGFVALVFGIPAPLLLYKYGGKLRAIKSSSY